MKWKNLEITSVLFLITNALFFLCGIHSLTEISWKSSILSMILGASLSYIALTLYLKFQENKILKLNSISPPIAILMIVFSIMILNYSLNRMTGFITYNVVSSISYYLLISSVLFISIFAVYKGFQSIVRSAFIYFLTILILIFITCIALFPKMDFQNVLPLLDTTAPNILKSMGLYMIISLTPYAYLPYFNVYMTKSKIASLKKGFILTQIFLIIYTLIVISILGIHITNLYPYPEVSIFKKVSFLNIIDRMESIFSLSYFLSLFTHFTITLYGIVELLQKFIFKEKRTIALFLTAFALFFLNSFYKTSISTWIISQVILLISCITLKSISSKHTL